MPYEQFAPNDPDISQMTRIVVHDKLRPSLPDELGQYAP